MKIKINIVLMLIVSAFFMFFGKTNLNAATLEEIKHQDIWFYRGEMQHLNLDQQDLLNTL